MSLPFCKLSITPKALRGFTLVEMVIALGIVGFAITAVVGLLPLGLQNFRKAMDLNLQTEMVQDLVAKAKRLPFDSLVELEQQEFSFDDSGNLLEQGGTFCAYTAKIAVASETIVPSEDGYQNTGLARITISFFRPDAAAGLPPAGTFVTFIAAGSGEAL